MLRPAGEASVTTMFISRGLEDPLKTALATYFNLMEPTLLYNFVYLVSREKVPLAWNDVCRSGLPKIQRCCKCRLLRVLSEIGCDVIHLRGMNNHSLGVEYLQFSLSIHLNQRCG